MRGIDFEVARGETFGFLGPNGAGKSTTIKILCTLARPTAGGARVAGHDVVAERDAVRRNIGLVFQDTTLDNYLTGAQNLRFHAELYAVPAAAVEPRMRQVLDMVGLWDRRDSLVSTYSGGHAAAAGDRPRPAARPARAVPRRADRRPGPADPLVDLGVHQRAEAAGGHHHLPDHALHGRGRALRPDRHHRPRQDRGHRHAGGAQGQRGQGPGADPDQPTTRPRSGSWPACSASRPPSTRVPSPSRSSRGSSSSRSSSPG